MILLNKVHQYENNPEQYIMNYKGVTMKFTYYLELELEVHGCYTPEDEGVTSLNVPPEDCYPGHAAEFETGEVYIIIKNADKTIKKIKCPGEIVELIDDDELMQLANDEYSDSI